MGIRTHAAAWMARLSSGFGKLLRDPAVLAAVGGTVLLGFQTLILWQQTQLIARQTDALTIDQAAHIRERIVGASSVEARLSALGTRLEAYRKEAKLSMCADPVCAATPVFPALRAINDDPPDPPEAAKGQLLRLAELLQKVEALHTAVLEEPAALDMNRKVDATDSIKKLAVDAVTQCFLDPDRGRELAEVVSQARLLASSSFAIRFRIGDPVGFKDMTTRFPQTDGNTKMQMIQFSDAAEQIADQVAPAGQRPVNRATYSLKDFSGTVFLIPERERLLVTEADAKCRQTISADAKALHRFEPQA